MAIWDRNDNRGNMGRGRNMADRAGEALRNGMDRMQHRGGYDRMDYNAGRANGGWNGDSYGAGGYMGGNNMGGGSMGRPMGNEYDRDFTYRGTPGANVNGGVGRDLGYGYGAGDRDEMGRGSMSYDRGYGMGGGGRMNNTGYDRGYGATGGAMGYDRGYRGGHDTDNGDPFGDRQQHTPFRVMRGHDGHPMGGQDRGGRGGMMGRGGGYDSSFAFGAPGMERTDINRGDRGNRLSSDRLDREELYDSNYRNRRDRDWF
ncbi:MAG TPA: hypothetical protein VF705_09065 [Longimicrobium sp.]